MLRTGRTVCWGGSIRSDVLVAEADTPLGFSDYWRAELDPPGIVADFVGDWLDRSVRQSVVPYSRFASFRCRIHPLDRRSRYLSHGWQRARAGCVKSDAAGFAVLSSACAQFQVFAAVSV